MRISDWSSDVCSSDLDGRAGRVGLHQKHFAAHILQSNISRGRQKVPIGQSDEDSFAPQILSMTPRQPRIAWNKGGRSEEHTSELQSLMRTSYAVFCLKKKTDKHIKPPMTRHT